MYIIYVISKMDNKTLIFIEKANKIHNDTYNYDKVKYINAKKK